MSYLVFARKYRPQVFEEVIGQRHVTRTLQNAIAAGRVAHALLFAGPRGVGKTSAARILAKALNCIHGPVPVPCGECESCQEITSGISMDVIEIDGASNRGINEIRELRESLKYQPAKSRSKIFIIDEVHMLTPEAFNALLKTLEEPPPHVLFIFATTEPNKIPVTILSRCQRFDFRRIPSREIVERLQDIVQREGVKISDNSIQRLAREAGGSMRDAQSLLDQVISFAGTDVHDEDVAEVLGVTDRGVLYDLSLAIASRDAQRCLEILNDVDQSGCDLRKFTRDLLEHLRNLLVVHLTKTPEALLDLPGDEIKELAEQSTKFDFRHVQQCFNVLLRSDGDLSRSTFPRLILETALLKMVDIQPVVPLDELLSRLETLEERISKSALHPIGRRGGRPSAGPGNRVAHDVQETSPKSPEVPQGEAGSSSGPDLTGMWKDLLESVHEQNPILGALLSHGRLIALDDQGIEIGFKEGSFYYDRIREEGNRRILGEIVRSLFGRDLHVNFTLIDGTRKDSAASKKARETDRDRRIRREVLESQIVQDALEILGGEIEEVKVETRLDS